MMQILRLLLVAIAAFIGYQAYRSYTYTTGRTTVETGAQILKLADSINAGQSRLRT
jgi:hypothetical protein